MLPTSQLLMAPFVPEPCPERGGLLANEEQPPLLLSPGFSAPSGKLTLTLRGATYVHTHTHAHIHTHAHTFKLTLTLRGATYRRVPIAT